MVGDAVVDQFQRTHGALTAWQEVEHTDDGHHTDIHATSVTIDPGGLTVKGDVSSGDGGFTGEGGNVAIGDLPITSVPGQPPQSGGYGIKIGPWRIISDAQNSPGTPSLPSLAFQFINEAFGTYLFRFMRAAAYDWALTPFAGVLLRLGRPYPGERIASVDTATLGVMSDATVGGALQVSGVSTLANLNASTINAAALGTAAWVRATGWFYESNRGVPLGHVTVYSYSVVDWTGLLTGTIACSLAGETETIWINASGTLGVGWSYLRFSIPDGGPPVVLFSAPIMGYTAATGWVPGIALGQPGNGFIDCYWGNGAGAWPSGAVVLRANFQIPQDY
jgi:hypothetical protein